MPIPVDLLSSYSLAMIRNYVSPVPSFFRDRYFVSGAGDIFASDYVLLERKKDSRKMADVVAKRVGDIPIERDGYEMFSYRPPKVAPSRLLTIDELEKRTFGEALYSGLTPAERAIKLIAEDEQELERRISFREEWFAVQCILNNGFEVQSYVDEVTPGEAYSLKFYEGNASGHVYTPAAAAKWGANSTLASISATVAAMANNLHFRGLPATDLVLGADAAEVFLGADGMMDRIDKNSGYITGELRETLTAYPGIVLLGAINFGGHILNIFSANVTYTDRNNQTQPFFPARGAMVGAPASGRMLYAAVTQMDHGSDSYSTHAATRVPKLIVDEENDTRKLRMTARPLPVPAADNPWIVCKNILA